jgi:tRNA-specific 2-thiouridylase
MSCAFDAERRDVTVGPREALERVTLTAADVNWSAVDPPADWVAVTAQIRYRHCASCRTCDARRAPAPAEVEFASPQTAISPGQAVVFYDGDVVVGGGWIQ